MVVVGGFVLGSLSGVWAHSEARLEAPGFIPAQWAAAAVPAGRAGGFKPPYRNCKAACDLKRKREQGSKTVYSHYQSLQETEAKG